MNSRFSLTFRRFKGGPGDKVMMRPPPFTRPADPYKQEPQPSHRFHPQPPPNKTSSDHEFMKYQVEQFELGKRHLANMMGLDPEMMSSQDIQKSIEYLFPTGIFAKSAKPVMKHPFELFPTLASLDVDESKRPRNPFFYADNIAINTTFFMLSKAIEDCDRLMEQGERPSKYLPYDPVTQSWADSKKLASILKLRTVEGWAMKHFNALIRRLA